MKARAPNFISIIPVDVRRAARHSRGRTAKMVKVKVGRRRLQGQGQGAGDRSELGEWRNTKGRPAAWAVASGTRWNLKCVMTKKKVISKTYA